MDGQMDSNNGINTDNFENLNFNAFLDNNILLDNDSDPDYKGKTLYV